jgi:hypothetical protein
LAGVRRTWPLWGFGISPSVVHIGSFIAAFSCCTWSSSRSSASNLAITTQALSAKRQVPTRCAP